MIQRVELRTHLGYKSVEWCYDALVKHFSADIESSINTQVPSAPVSPTTTVRSTTQTRTLGHQSLPQLPLQTRPTVGQ